MAHPKHHIIGLCGFSGAGKDTVGQLLATHAGFRMLAFANPLRAEAAEAFSVESLLFTRREFKEQPMPELALSRTTDRAFLNAALLHLAETEPNVPRSEQLVKPRSPRWVMETWATEYRRAQDPDYWVRQVTEHIQFCMEDWHERRFVITDVRFPNEAAAIRARGGQIWKVKRPGLVSPSSHLSATDGSQYSPDVVINNAHDIRHLQQLVLAEHWARDAGLEHLEVRIS